MSDEQLIKSYMASRTIKGAALSLGMPYHKVGSRIRKLRKAGVRIPSFGYTPIEQADVDRLNELLRSY